MSVEDTFEDALAAVPWILPGRTSSWDEFLTYAKNVRDLKLPLSVRRSTIQWLLRRTRLTGPT
jgi:hypothetical protein